MNKSFRQLFLLVTITLISGLANLTAHSFENQTISFDAEIYNCPVDNAQSCVKGVDNSFAFSSIPGRDRESIRIDFFTFEEQDDKQYEFKDILSNSNYFNSLLFGLSFTDFCRHTNHLLSFNSHSTQLSNCVFLLIEVFRL